MTSKTKIGIIVSMYSEISANKRKNVVFMMFFFIVLISGLVGHNLACFQLDQYVTYYVVIGGISVCTGELLF